MLYQSVVGQEEIKNHLIQMVQRGRMPHALLISGHSGAGTLPLALATAQYLQCDAPTDKDSCGVCTPCKQILQLQHPDVHFSFPTISAKPGAKNLSEAYIKEFKEFIRQTPYADIYDWYQFIDVENKQGNISADECRNLLERMQLKSYQGKYKIAIMWRPEYLGKEGNMLLKFIEEPSPNTIIIFIAEQEDRILSTIKSRLQKVYAKPLSPSSISQSLIHNYKKTEPEAQKIAFMAKGDYGQALKLMNHWDDDMVTLVTQWLNATYTNNGVKINEWVETVSKMGRESIKNFLVYLQELFTAALRVSYAPALPIQLPDSDASIVAKLGKMRIPMDIYEDITRDLATKAYNIERNAHIKIQLQHLSIQMQYWLKGTRLSSY